MAIKLLGGNVHGAFGAYGTDEGVEALVGILRDGVGGDQNRKPHAFAFYEAWSANVEDGYLRGMGDRALGAIEREGFDVGRFRYSEPRPDGHFMVAGVKQELRAGREMYAIALAAGRSALHVPVLDPETGGKEHVAFAHLNERRGFGGQDAEELAKYFGAEFGDDGTVVNQVANNVTVISDSNSGSRAGAKPIPAQLARGVAWGVRHGLPTTPPQSTRPPMTLKRAFDMADRLDAALDNEVPALFAVAGLQRVGPAVHTMRLPGFGLSAQLDHVHVSGDPGRAANSQVVAVPGVDHLLWYTEVTPSSFAA